MRIGSWGGFVRCRTYMPRWLVYRYELVSEGHGPNVFVALCLRTQKSDGDLIVRKTNPVRICLIALRDLSGW